MNDKDKMIYAVRKAREFKMLGGSPLMLFPDIYDGDQVNVYEPLGIDSVINMGTIIKDALSDELQGMLNDGDVLVVDFRLIGAIPTEETMVMR